MCVCYVSVGYVCVLCECRLCVCYVSVGYVCVM